MDQQGWVGAELGSWCAVPKDSGIQPPLIVGGQAVRFWSARYDVRHPDSPNELITTEDCDLVVNDPKQLDEVAKKVDGTLYRTPPHYGGVARGRIDGQVQIEFLSSLYGVDDEELRKNVAEIHTDHGLLLIADPVTLLKGKVENVIGLSGRSDDGRRRDQIHVDVLTVCVDRYICQIASEQNDQGAWAIKQYKRLLLFRKSKAVRQIDSLHPVPWKRCYQQGAELKTKADRIRQFLERTFEPQWRR